MGRPSTRVIELRSINYPKGEGSVSGKMISTHLVGTESNLQCCNDGEGLAEIFPPTLGSYLESKSSY